MNDDNKSLKFNDNNSKIYNLNASNKSNFKERPDIMVLDDILPDYRNWSKFIIIQLQEVDKHLNQMDHILSIQIKEYCSVIESSIWGIMTLLRQNNNEIFQYESYFASITSINYGININRGKYSKDQLIFIINTSSKLVIIERMIKLLIEGHTDFTARKMTYQSNDLPEDVVKEEFRKLSIRDKDD